MDFHGAKIALLVADRVVVISRDDDPRIPWPGRWDLPGGGREGDESALDCVRREATEELNLAVGSGRIFWARRYAAGPTGTWFFAARLGAGDLRGVRLGAEGTAWRLMPVPAFIGHPRAVPHLQARLRTCLRRRPL